MNERIKELWDKAAQAAAAYPSGQNNSWETQVNFMEKFAELIIKECAELFVDRRYMVLNPLEPFADERVRVMKAHDKDTVKTIKKHFGVEE